MGKKIVITGGTGRFSQSLKKIRTNHKVLFPTKRELDILNLKKIERYLSKKKPDILVHCAGLSRPIKIHEKEVNRSIDLNIIGTANVTKACVYNNIKLIYLSTNYVYPGVKGNYKEKDPILPINSYAWSKLGGECSVQLYRNSLILRVCMTERPFVHKKAFVNVKTSFIFHDEAAKILFKVLNKKGVLNIGGKTQSVYDFAKKYNKKIKKNYLKKNSKHRLTKNSSINLQKLKKYLRY